MVRLTLLPFLLLLLSITAFAAAPVGANASMTDTRTAQCNKLQSVNVAVSNSVIIDNDQIQVLTANALGGKPPLSYRFSISNTLGIVSNNTLMAVNSMSDTFSFNQRHSWGTGTFAVNVTVIKLLGIGDWVATENAPGHGVFGQGALSCAPNNSYVYCVGESANTINNTFYARFSSSGIVGNWINATSYPVSAKHTYKAYALGTSCNIYAGYIFCIGGNHANTLVTSDAFYAPISANGIGKWVPTTAYPINIYKQQCIVNGTYIYCVGGKLTTGDNTTNKAYYAPISSSGIGKWTQTSSYPLPIRSFDCFLFDNNIYCTTGINNKGEQQVSYYAPISSSGIGKWTQTTSYPVKASHTGRVSNSTADYGFAIGDYNTAGVPLGIVLFSQMTPQGLASWTQTTTFPFGTAYAGCFEAANDIYCVGGTNSKANNTAVYYAPIDFLTKSTSTTYTARAVPTATLSVSDPEIVSGQTQTLNIQLSGGIGPFTINFINVTGGSSSVVNTIISQQTGILLSKNLAVSSPTTGNVFSYKAIVTDKGTNDTFDSTAANFTIYSLFPKPHSR